VPEPNPGWPGFHRPPDDQEDGLDLFRQTVGWILGIKPEEVTKEQRREAEAVSFGLRFGRDPNA